MQVCDADHLDTASHLSNFCMFLTMSSLVHDDSLQSVCLSHSILLEPLRPFSHQHVGADDMSSLFVHHQTFVVITQQDKVTWQAALESCPMQSYTIAMAMKMRCLLLQASKVESLLKATLPHLALDRKDQAAQGKTALPSDLQNLRHVERLYGNYLQGIAAKSAQRPQSRQQPASLATSQAAEGFVGSQGLSKLPVQQAPAQSAASSRAPTPQPLEPASVQAPMPQLAAPAESSGEAPGKVAYEELDLTETSRPNAVAAALVSLTVVLHFVQRIIGSRFA